MRRRARGSISRLPSGSLRVRVYAGTNPVTGRQRCLSETVAAGSTARAQAEDDVPPAAGAGAASPMLAGGCDGERVVGPASGVAALR